MRRIVTEPESMAFYVVTEYGLVSLEAKTSWEGAELLVSIAHPSFQQELIQPGNQGWLPWPMENTANHKGVMDRGEGILPRINLTTIY